MDRREFIKVSSLTAAAAVTAGSLLTTTEPSTTAGCLAAEPEPFLALQGGPFRKSCDGLACYNNVSFEEMTEDIIHFRMPAEWRERFVLGISDLGGRE